MNIDIEVGTWNASIGPWREKYGRELRGVGGMNKTVFAQDRGAIDAEIERLKPLVALGGYIPCPDHRIAPDAKGRFAVAVNPGEAEVTVTLPQLKKAKRLLGSAAVKGGALTVPGVGFGVFRMVS